MGASTQIIKTQRSHTHILGAIFLVLWGLAGCQPRDVDPRYGTVEAGKVGSMVANIRSVKSPSKNFDFKVNYIEVKDQVGAQLSTCSGGVWDDIRVHDRSKKDVVYKSIYSGQRVAAIGAANNCHKVGRRVLISSVSDGTGSNYGHAVVTKLMLIDRSEITEEMKAALDINDFALDSILRESQTASILVFKYVEGSAPAEERFLSADVVVPNGVLEGQVGSLVTSLEGLDSPSKDLIVENSVEAVEKIGASLSTCSRGGWTDIRVYDRNLSDQDYKALYSNIYTGERVADINRARNCHTVGMRILIGSLQAGDGSHFGEAVVTGIYIFNVEDLTDELLAQAGFDREGLQRYLKPGETQLSYLVFKYLRGTATQEAQFLNAATPVAPEEGAEPNPAVVTVPPSVIPAGPEGEEPAEGTTPPSVTPGPAVSNTNPATHSTFIQRVESVNADIQVAEYVNRKALLSTCTSNRAWTDFRSFRKLDSEMIAGKRTMAITKGKNNCYQPTDILNIHSSDGTVYEGQVLIKEVFVMRASDLTPEIIAATAQSQSDVVTYIGSEEWVHVTVFEYVPYNAALASEVVDENNLDVPVVVEGAVASRPGHVLSSCQQSVNPILFVNAQDEAAFATSSYKKAYVLSQTPCWAVGSVVTLTHIETGVTVLDQRVRLTRVEQKTLAEMTAEDLKQLGYADITTLATALSQLWGKTVTMDQLVTVIFIRN